MRTDSESIAKAVEQLSFHYSNNFCSVLMLMLQWESANRPDFVTLETLMNNEILKMKNKEQSRKLFNALLDSSRTDRTQKLHQTVGVMIGRKKVDPASTVPDCKIKLVYQLLYPDV